MHTKTPWKAFIKGTVIEVEDADGNPIIAWPGFDSSHYPVNIDKDNAVFIVRAVNSHEALLEACKALLLRSQVDEIGLQDWMPEPPSHEECEKLARAALSTPTEQP